MRGKSIFVLVFLLALSVAAGTYWKMRNVAEFGDKLRDLNSAQEITEVKTAESEMAAINDRTQAGLASRFPNAKPQITEVAAMIMRGEGPDPSQLDRIEAVDLNASYSRPFPKKQPGYIHTLLREAVLSSNLEAVRSLIEAGANIHFNEDEMPHLATQQIAAGRDRAFPDYSVGNAIMTEWLGGGGDPNVHNAFYGSLGPLLSTVPQTNLEGQLILLRAGADPWHRVLLRVTPSGHEQWSWTWARSVANASPISCEVAFRVAREGLIPLGPKPLMEEMRAEYELAVANHLGGTGPEAQRALWQLRMAIGALFSHLAIEPIGDLNILLSMDILGDAGGFWLAPGEVRSSDDPDQIVRGDHTHGTETWSEMPQ